LTVKADITSLTPTPVAIAAFQAAGQNLNALLGTLKQQAGEMQILLKQLIKLHPNDSVVSATVNAGGSGGTNGPVTITGTTGTGTKFTLRGNVASGALTGPLTVVNAGSYTVDPTSLTAEPVTGGSLSGATVGLTMSGDNTVLSALSSILAELA
jgi:hypothetical protein